MDVVDAVTIVLGTLGGLALFLYGLHNLSDSLEKSAGERIRQILTKLTDNPLKDCFLGAFTASVLQSRYHWDACFDRIISLIQACAERFGVPPVMRRGNRKTSVITANSALENGKKGKRRADFISGVVNSGRSV